jgi:hypothetical protein
MCTAPPDGMQEVYDHMGQNTHLEAPTESIGSGVAQTRMERPTQVHLGCWQLTLWAPFSLSAKWYGVSYHTE